MPSKKSSSRRGSSGSAKRSPRGGGRPLSARIRAFTGPDDPPSSALLVLALLTAAALAVRLVYLNIPVRYDEAYTYLHFASQPLTRIVSDYSLPNNHILHSLLVKASTSVFGDGEWAIRLPVLIAGVLLVPALFLAGARLDGWKTGLLAAGFCTASYWLVDYSVNARGYIIVCLFTTLMIIAAGSLRKPPRRASAWVLLTASGIAGLYTMPTAAFPLTAVFLWLAAGVRGQGEDWDRSMLRSLVLAGITVVAGAAALYLPVVFGSGLESLTGNRFVQSLPAGEFFGRLPGLARQVAVSFHRDLPLPLILLLAGAFLYGCRLHPALAGSALLGVAALLVLKRSIPPPRTFLFGEVFYFLIAAAGLGRLITLAAGRLDKFSPTVAACSLATGWVAVAAAMLLHHGSPLRSPGSYPEAEEVASFLAANTGRNDFLLSSLPAIEPVGFYLRQKTDGGFGYSPEKGGKPDAVVALINLRKESLESVMAEQEDIFAFFVEPRKIAHIDSSEIYRFRPLDPADPQYFDRSLEIVGNREDLTAYEMHFYLEVAQAMLGAGRSEDAEFIADRALRSDSTFFEAWYLKGKIYQEAGNWAKADSFYRRSLEIEPRNASVLINLGTLQHKLGNVRRAKEYYEMAVQADSTRFEPLYNLGNLCLQDGEIQAAVDYLTRAARAMPDNGRIYITLGMAQSRAGAEGRRRALESFRRAAELLPSLAGRIRREYIVPLERMPGRSGR